MKQTYVTCRMVEFIPEQLEDGVLYVSRRYGTAVHKCCCGCGEEVVTPVGPTDWSLRMDSGLVTLHPSIGNWSYACRAHYWIRQGRVVWAAPMSQKQIDAGRAFDQAAKQTYFDAVNRKKSLPLQAVQSRGSHANALYSLWTAVKRWWHSGPNEPG